MGVFITEVIQPSVKLARMVSLLKVLAFVHFALIIGDIFFFGTSTYFFLLFQFLLILMGIITKYFGYYSYFNAFCFITIYSCIIKLGARFQAVFYKKVDPVPFCFFAFVLIFQIFCIYVMFQTYKQTKHEYRIKYGYIDPDEGLNENNEQINNNLENNNIDLNADNANIENNIDNNDGEFAPLQGQGIHVEGN